MDLQKSPRYKILLAKCQVSQVKRGSIGCKFVATLPNGTTFDVDLSFVPDVRVGDILSIYTEVLADVSRSH